MASQPEIWAYSEKPILLGELLGGARVLAEKLSGRVIAVIVGPHTIAEDAIKMGAEKVYWLGDIETRLVEDYVPTLAELLKEYKPAILLIGNTKRGKAIAGRVAARLGASAMIDVKDFIPSASGVSTRHMIFGGGAVREEKPQTDTLIATVGLGNFENADTDANRSGEIIAVPFIKPEWKAKLLGRKEKKVTSVNLAAAKRVVCAGRGLSKQEDLVMINELAHLLEAEVGCTRPLAEGLDWLPRERYIGVSGAFIKPDLYLGIGVSGQVQHTVGITDSRVIVGINKDKDAAIFSQADYGIVGDLYAVVPALISALKARK